MHPRFCFRRKCACVFALIFFYFNPPLFAQQTSRGTFVTSRSVFEDQVSANSRHVVRTNPGIGSGIIGIVDRNNEIIISDYIGGRVAAGVDLQSAGGFFGETVDDSTPFPITIVSDPNRVSLGALGVDQRVVVGPQLPLGVTYSGDNPSEDIQAVWGRGTEEVPFPITRSGEIGFTPWNLRADGGVWEYSDAIMSAVIEAGSAAGVPPDSPANRVDPNDGSAMFPGVGSLEIVHPTLGTFICSASVIDDNKLLTAAHCFDQDSDGMVDAGILGASQFYLNDGGSPSATRAIDMAVLHPDFDGFDVNGGHDDIAVVTLSSDLPAGTTKYPFRNSGMSFGEVIEMVGYGISGFGDVGGVEVFPDYHVKRSGKNQAELFVLDDEGQPVEEVFIYDFDGPSGDGFLGGGTLGNDIEGGVRGGDSGGPAFVDVDGTKAIAGLISFEFVLDGITPPTGEFGVMGGGPMIDEANWAFIKENAPGATLVPEPHGVIICLPLVLVGLLMRKRR